MARWHSSGNSSRGDQVPRDRHRAAVGPALLRDCGAARRHRPRLHFGRTTNRRRSAQRRGAALEGTRAPRACAMRMDDGSQQRARRPGAPREPAAGLIIRCSSCRTSAAEQPAARAAVTSRTRSASRRTPASSCTPAACGGRGRRSLRSAPPAGRFDWTVVFQTRFVPSSNGHHDSARVRYAAGVLPAALLDYAVSSASIGLALYDSSNANNRTMGTASGKVGLT